MANKNVTDNVTDTETKEVNLNTVADANSNNSTANIADVPAINANPVTLDANGNPLQPQRVDPYKHPVVLPPVTNLGTLGIPDPNALSNTQNPSFPKNNVANLRNTSNPAHPANPINPLNKSTGGDPLSPGRPLASDTVSGTGMMSELDKAMMDARIANKQDVVAQLHSFKNKLGELLNHASSFDHAIYTKIKDFFMGTSVYVANTPGVVDKATADAGAVNSNVNATNVETPVNPQNPNTNQQQ